MHRAQEQVRQFHIRVMKSPHSPAQPMLRNPEFRAHIGLEEMMELTIALLGAEKAARLIQKVYDEIGERVRANPEKYEKPNLAEAVDGVCDTIFVAYGTAEDLGVDLEPFYEEVVRSNMAKEGGEVRPDGKLLKPAVWTPPDIQGILDALTAQKEGA